VRLKKSLVKAFNAEGTYENFKTGENAQRIGSTFIQLDLIRNLHYCPRIKNYTLTGHFGRPFYEISDLTPYHLSYGYSSKLA